MVMFGKWEFDPMDHLLPPSFPVHLWQGCEDGIVPASLQKHISQRVGWIKYHEVPDGGHFLNAIPGFDDHLLKTLLLQPWEFLSCNYPARLNLSSGKIIAKMFWNFLSQIFSHKLDISFDPEERVSYLISLHASSINFVFIHDQRQGIFDISLTTQRIF